MKISRFFPIMLAVAISSCSSTKFSHWQGNKVLTGEGGTKEVVEGIDIWTTGTPPLSYKVIGVIDDRRNTGVLYMARQKKDLAVKAAENGGDAIIITSKDIEYMGSINTGGTSSTYGTAQSYGNNTYYQSTSYNSGGTSIPMNKQNTKAYVIKYLPKVK